ncbi:hypothetical protein EHS25_007087 [Saitozyma podzolica]|uniref:Gfo/Idh/MocA-like oxidoreductase N-terminal domain-containing protein n=1 Tax=Saitozyma podzolica TaxID=1890683 RepID=A0A427XPJ6_9TREE|nr:hypothetical protein EHS25_007087 [Saitozyma podzolica]
MAVTMNGTTNGSSNGNGHVKPAKLKVAILGCGRMGQRHAHNIFHLTPRASLVAVADPSPAAKTWVQENLDGVQYFEDPEQVFDLPGLDAVIISTITSTHAPLTIKAVEKGLHVLLEKPISIDVEDSRPVLAVADSRPDLKVMIGFVRRFDTAFKQLHTHLTSTAAGQPFLLKSTTQDAYDPSGFFVAYAKASGGIFMDCGIHDIDMSRWFLGVGQPAKNNTNGLSQSSRPPVLSGKQVNRVYATGLTVRHPELHEQDDCDNALGVIEYANGSSCTLHLSRTGMGGYESLVEVFGTEQKLVVETPASSHVEVTDGHGRRVESAPTYIERFGEAFIHEVKAFVDCCLDDKPVPTSVADAFQAALIAKALTQSFRTGKPVDFGDDGEPIL